MATEAPWADTDLIEELEDQGLVEESEHGSYALIWRGGRLQRYRARGRKRDDGGWMARDEILSRLPRTRPGDLNEMARTGVLQTTLEGEQRLYRIRHPGRGGGH